MNTIEKTSHGQPVFLEAHWSGPFVPVGKLYIFIENSYCAASIKICINGCGCLCLWETWLRNLNFAVRLEEVWVRSSAWVFFLHTFFITFIKFSSAVKMSWSIQNFSTITIFLEEKFSVFWFWKNRFKISSAKCHTKFKFPIKVSYKQGHPHSLMQILIDAAQYKINWKILW